MTRATAIAGLEARLLLADPFPILLLLAMPLVVLSFLAKGLVGGPAHSVPGLAAMFGFFGLAIVGLAFFRDHGWGTWDRLRASGAHPAELMVGKALPLVGLLILQQVVLLVAGWRFFDMPWEGSVLAALPLVLAVVTVEVALGMLLVTVCTTIDQLAVASYLGALLLAGLGGALTPVESLPGWVQEIAPASPVYWTLQGFDVVVAGAGGTGDLVAAVSVLLAFAVAAAALTASLYRFDARKHYFA
jgi:ABC-2 type transport system permease protein